MTEDQRSAIKQDVDSQVGGFFNRANRPVIQGGVFTSVIHQGKDSPEAQRERAFERLQGNTAPSAFHNSKQRSNPPRCHDGTRKAVLDEIFQWIVGNDDREEWLAWINGAAGAGKSAICQSISEMCIAQGLLVASFFFFRTDSTRNAIDPLIPSLVYQIIQLLPETKTLVMDAIVFNPLIFQQSLETQIELLISQPLRSLLASGNSTWSILLVIDGLDECFGHESQMNAIRAFGNLLKARDLPLIVLFGSRHENQIHMAFNARDVDRNLLRIPLDNNYLPDRDIELFLNDSFSQIKETHPLGKRLPHDWPPQSHVQQIVDKSSGQFIYASVVIKFVSSPTFNPSTLLDIVRGLRPSGRMTPFAELDTLYRHIFSQVEDLPTTLNFLAYIIFEKPMSLKWPLHFFGLTEDDVESSLASLTSILSCDLEKDTVTFLHASLPDFLLDHSRSREYCINSLPTQLSILWFENALSGRFQHLPASQQNLAIVNFLPHTEPTPEIRSYIISLNPSLIRTAFWYTDFAREYLSAVKQMDFGDSGEAYRRQLEAIVHFIASEYPHRLLDVGSAHDISDISHSESTSKGSNEPESDHDKQPRTGRPVESRQFTEIRREPYGALPSQTTDVCERKDVERSSRRVRLSKWITRLLNVS